MSSLGFGSGLLVSHDDKYEQVKGKVMDALKDFFRPEFLNRLDEIVLFNILTPAAIQAIVRMQVEIVAQRLAEKHITLSLTPAAVEYFSKEGYNPQYGARPLKRLIQTKLLTPIANMMISRGVMDGGSVIADWSPTAGADGKGDFTFDVRKGPERQRGVRARAKQAIGA